jgi:arginyl-tRNA synthetase
MLAYKKWAKCKTPESEKRKSDHFVGDYYVMYAKKETEQTKKDLYEMLKKWEDNDKEVRALWKKMNKWALDGFKKTYDLFNFKHHKEYFESNTYIEGKKVVQDWLKKGLFKKDADGAAYIEFKDKQLGKKVLQRADGTAVYITQDLALTEDRYRDYKMDRAIWVVGSEQIYHFKVLFKIFELMKKPYAKGCFHLAYGMVYLPEGKMKSREGQVVDADDLVAEMKAISMKEIKNRYKDLSAKEAEKRSSAIGMGALRFFILKHDPMKDMTYDPKESISFEGETGPYVQYAYARICSILKKFGTKTDDLKPDYTLLQHEKEKKILQLLKDYPEKIKEAADNYKPSVITRYLLDLSQSFNEFYHECPILQEKEDLRTARLFLILAVREVLKNGLGLLEIEVLEEM